MTASLDICHFLPLLFVGYFPLRVVIRLSWALFRVINKPTRHLGQKCRGDHSPRTQSPLLANMLHLSSDGNFARSLAGRPRMFVSPHTQDIGPGLSLYTVGTQGKIGPHNSPSKSCFSSPREKRRILILSSDLPYDLVLLGQIATTRVYLFATRS